MCIRDSSVGSPASTFVMRRATVLPATAIAITPTAATCWPWLPATWKINPPQIMPSKIASEVPISTKPLPPVNSSGLSTDGRIEYFTGPNNVDLSLIHI